MSRLRVEDSTGQDILDDDLVLFKTPGAHGDRGLALKALPGKKLSVLCVDGAEVVVEARDVSVVDRSTLWRGMTVVSARDSGGQAGIITDTATAGLDLAQLTDSGEVVVVARDVSLAKLPSVIDLSVGNYVVSGHWLGRVVEASVDVDVMFDDGAVCRVADARGKLETLLDSKLVEGVLYLGQQVLGQGSVFKDARWLKGCWKPSREKGTVVKTEASRLVVYWVASSQVGAPGSWTLVQASAPPPACHPNSSNLTFFCSGDFYSPKFLVVGTHYCFSRDPAPASTTESVPPAQRMEELDRAMHVVANTNTTADVVWQDGTRQYGVPSASLVPLLDLNEYDLIPGERVVRTDSDANDEPRMGVVRSFNHKDKTARVSWFSPAESATSEETVSAYNLDPSSNQLGAYYGDVVVRLRPADSSAGEGCENTQGQQEKKKDLSWVGRVTDLCDDGHHIQVRWGDGNMSKVLRHQVAVVKPRSIPDMLHEMCPRLPNSDDDAHDDGDQGDEGYDSHSDDEEDGPAAATTTMGWAGSVIQAMIRLAGNVLAKSRMVSGRSSSAKEAADAGSPQCQGGGDDSFRFPRFDVVPSPPDHHYLDNMEQGSTGGGNKWIKRVQKEWKILEDNLPDTIYVRACEDRMDLFRAVMAGATGTPYHDGLFFFDLQLPPSYPAAPPLVCYRSFGLRVNPNLYESGTVCLSLLNTYGGEGAELWSPTTSSVLQVLVSIQGLVLTALPYYNEDGYSAFVGTPEGRRNELPYSENAYLRTVQTMLHLLRRPPAGFEGFVREHFRRRGRHVLRACEAYLDGCTVGTLDGEARPTEVSRERPCSAGFRLALGDLVPRLLQAFKEIGADGC